VEGVVARYHDERGEGGRRVRVLVGAYPASERPPARSVSRRPWSSRPRAPTP
jgi:hypothetical protein